MAHHQADIFKLCTKLVRGTAEIEERLTVSWRALIAVALQEQIKAHSKPYRQADTIKYAARSLATIAISIQEASLCPSTGLERFHFPESPETTRSVHTRSSGPASWLQ